MTLDEKIKMKAQQEIKNQSVFEKILEYVEDFRREYLQEGKTIGGKYEYR